MRGLVLVNVRRYGHRLLVRPFPGGRLVVTIGRVSKLLWCYCRRGVVWLNRFKAKPGGIRGLVRNGRLGARLLGRVWVLCRA